MGCEPSLLLPLRLIVACDVARLLEVGFTLESAPQRDQFRWVQIMIQSRKEVVRLRPTPQAGSRGKRVRRCVQTQTRCCPTYHGKQP